MSLASVAERLSSIDHSAVRLETKRCLHSQDQFSTCEACFAICPVSAIQPGKPPVYNSDLCVTCLACIQACPVDAYAGDDGIQALLTCVARLETDHIEVLCEKNPFVSRGCASENIGVQVRGCLAGLGVGALLALAALGAEHITLRTDACAECKWGILQALIDDHITQTQALLVKWGKAKILESVSNIQGNHVRPLWNAQNPPLSRRDLFRLAARQGQVALARSMEHTSSTSAHLPGRERRRIINALEHLSALKSENDPILAEVTYATVSVSDSCTACGICARTCPTGALHYLPDADETTFQLTLTPQFCIGCELCAHTCAANAIVIGYAPLFSQVFEAKTDNLLRNGNLAHCEKCRAAYAGGPETHLCPACSFRNKNPFGSRIPPGIKMPPRVLSERRSS